MDIIQKKNPKTFLEIGIFHGVTARNVCELMFKNHGDNFNYIGIDIFDDSDNYKNEVVPSKTFNNPIKTFYFKYIKRQNLTRLISLYEIFKMTLDIKGSVVECGVNQGFGVMTWAKLSAILEPTNLTRRIYGYDTFDGFPEVSDQDLSLNSKHIKPGDLAADTFSELEKLEMKNLKDKILVLRKESLNLRFQKSSGQLEKTDQLRKVRRNIARVKTILTQKADA